MPRSPRRITLAAALAAAPLALAPAVAGASPAPDLVKVAGGSTAVTLDSDTAALLTGQLGLDIAPVAGAYVKNGAINFPVRPSQLNPTTLAGQIEHSGGLRFRAGQTALTLDAYDINVDKSPDLTARVDFAGRNRGEIFDLDLSGAEVTTAGKKVVVDKVVVTLSADGAAALNATFGLSGASALPAGATIGTAKVTTYVKSSLNAARALRLAPQGGTAVALDAGTAGTLQALGVAVAPAGRAKVNAFGRVVFPISGGHLMSGSLAGDIDHVGGLELTAGATTVGLWYFEINTETGLLEGSVYVNGTRVARAPLFKLGLGNLETVVTNKDLRLSEVGLSLTAQAAGLLNQTFGVQAFAEDLPIGTATVDGISRPKGASFAWTAR